jgi:hypothetical protein
MEMQLADALPTAELPALARPHRRTQFVRGALALAVLSLAAAVVLDARALARPTAALLPAGRAGVAVVDLSGSIGVERTREIGRAVARVDTAEERLGLVVFSDTAYELLPPGTPATHLAPLARLFTQAPGIRNFGFGDVRTQFPPTPWDRVFRAGTSIATGLVAGLQALERGHVRKGALLLVSDLDDDPQDAHRLAAIAAELSRRDVPLKILALRPTPSGRALFTQLFGKRAFVHGADSVASSGVGRRLQATLSAPIPWTLVALALFLLALLAGNELYCGRLPVPRRRIA